MQFQPIIKGKISNLALVILLMLTVAGETVAQFTFIGDFDNTFSAPTGYFVEPQNNFPGDATPNRRTYFVSGELNPDSSHRSNSNKTAPLLTK